MKTLLKSHHPVRQVKSFKYAFKGIHHTLMNEPNFRIQVVIVLCSVFLGYHYRITTVEWCVLVIAMAMLLIAEMINTVVEEFIDNMIKEYHEGARIIKDMSAGFVLITAIAVLIILILIFGLRFF